MGKLKIKAGKGAQILSKCDFCGEEKYNSTFMFFGVETDVCKECWDENNFSGGK